MTLYLMQLLALLAGAPLEVFAALAGILFGIGLLLLIHLW